MVGRRGIGRGSGYWQGDGELAGGRGIGRGSEKVGMGVMMQSTCNQASKIILSFVLNVNFFIVFLLFVGILSIFSTW